MLKGGDVGMWWFIFLKQPHIWNIFVESDMTSIDSPTVDLYMSNENNEIHIPHVNLKYYKC